MKRLDAIAIAFYVAHLAEEALTGMHDDPLIAFAYAPLAPLGARHAAYLVFQITFALALVASVLPARILRLTLAFAMLGEAHHVIRALCTHHLDSGLFTSIPLPIVAALILQRELSCFTTSSSPWASVASSWASLRSSQRNRLRGSSVFRARTTTRPRA